MVRCFVILFAKTKHHRGGQARPLEGGDFARAPLDQCRRRGLEAPGQHHAAGHRFGRGTGVSPLFVGWEWVGSVPEEREHTCVGRRPRGAAITLFTPFTLPPLRCLVHQLQVAFYLNFVRSRNLAALGRSREALVNALANEEAYATFGADPGDVAKILASVRLCIDYQRQGADFYDPDNALEADSYRSPWDTDQANPATPFVEAHPWLKDLYASLGTVHPGGFAIRFSALQWFAAAGPRLVRFLLAGGYAGASEPTKAETDRLAETVKKAAVKKNDGQDVGEGLASCCGCRVASCSCSKPRGVIFFFFWVSFLGPMPHSTALPALPFFPPHHSPLFPN